MEEKKHSLALVTLGYGAIISFIVIALVLLFYLLDVDFELSMWLIYIPVFAGILVYQIAYRNKFMGGYITYSKCFLTGFLTTLFYSLFFLIFIYLFINFIDTGLIEEAKLAAEEEMIRRGSSDEEIDMGVKILERFMSVILGLALTLRGLIIGFIISLITSIFIKKDNPDVIPMS